MATKVKNRDKSTEKSRAHDVNIYIRELENIYYGRVREKERAKKALLDRFNVAINGKEIVLENTK